MLVNRADRRAPVGDAEALFFEPAIEDLRRAADLFEWRMLVR
jgi:hypothetical protein